MLASKNSKKTNKTRLSCRELSGLATFVPTYK